MRQRQHGLYNPRRIHEGLVSWLTDECFEFVWVDGRGGQLARADPNHPKPQEMIYPIALCRDPDASLYPRRSLHIAVWRAALCVSARFLHGTVLWRVRPSDRPPDETARPTIRPTRPTVRPSHRPCEFFHQNDSHPINKNRLTSTFLQQ